MRRPWKYHLLWYQWRSSETSCRSVLQQWHLLLTRCACQHQQQWRSCTQPWRKASTTDSQQQTVRHTTDFSQQDYQVQSANKVQAGMSQHPLPASRSIVPSEMPSICQTKNILCLAQMHWKINQMCIAWQKVRRKLFVQSNYRLGWITQKLLHKTRLHNTLCKEWVFSFLVLRHFVQSMLSALFAFTECSPLFRYVNLQYKKMWAKSIVTDRCNICLHAI